MIKHIIKIIWAQRKTNLWIFIELLVVVGVVWVVSDSLWVEQRTYHSPLGYDITNTWRFKLDLLKPGAPDYVTEEDYDSDQAADLQQLMSRIRQHPLVEEVSASFYSFPYSYGNSWSSIKLIDGDSAGTYTDKSYQIRRVTPEYFDVFRVTDKNGNPIRQQLEGRHNSIALSVDLESILFPGETGIGRKVEIYDLYTIHAITMPIRFDDYRRSEPCVFMCLEGPSFESSVSQFGGHEAEICVRMKQDFTTAQMTGILEEMGDRLTVNNLYVYGVRSVADFRTEQIKPLQDKSAKRLSLILFLLINVFFGIVGTFWLRTQHRQGEIGVRIALGASHTTIKKYMLAEGLCLLSMTLPFVLLFAANVIYMDYLDTYRQPLTLARFLITFGGTYLLIAGMIVLGIWIPIRKTEKLAPAEALHYE